MNRMHLGLEKTYGLLTYSIVLCILGVMYSGTKTRVNVPMEKSDSEYTLYVVIENR